MVYGHAQRNLDAARQITDDTLALLRTRSSLTVAQAAWVRAVTGNADEHESSWVLAHDAWAR